MIYNLTQHQATPEQLDAGVVEPKDSLTKETIRNVLTFSAPPTRTEMTHAANSLADIVHHSGCRSAMIGGAPYFMPFLEEALGQLNIRPLYSFSQRVSVEKVDGDGKVTKVSEFKHIGFVGMEYAEIPKA